MHNTTNIRPGKFPGLADFSVTTYRSLVTSRCLEQHNTEQLPTTESNQWVDEISNKLPTAELNEWIDEISEGLETNVKGMYICHVPKNGSISFLKNAVEENRALVEANLDAVILRTVFSFKSSCSILPFLKFMEDTFYHSIRFRKLFARAEFFHNDGFVFASLLPAWKVESKLEADGHLAIPDMHVRAWVQNLQYLNTLGIKVRLEIHLCRLWWKLVRLTKYMLPLNTRSTFHVSVTWDESHWAKVPDDYFQYLRDCTVIAMTQTSLTDTYPYCELVSSRESRDYLYVHGLDILFGAGDHMSVPYRPVRRRHTFHGKTSPWSWEHDQEEEEDDDRV